MSLCWACAGKYPLVHLRKGRSVSYICKVAAASGHAGILVCKFGSCDAGDIAGAASVRV